MSEFSGAAATAIADARSYTPPSSVPSASAIPLRYFAPRRAPCARRWPPFRRRSCRCRERPGKWSMLQVAQHLADAELVGAFRYRMILAHDTSQPDRADHQDRWAERLRYAEADLAGALEHVRALRAANLRLLD